jgi:hypothetical protein
VLEVARSVRDLVSPDLPLHPRWTPLVGLRGLPSCPSPSPAGAPRSSSDRGACGSFRTSQPPPHLSFTCLVWTEPERLAALTSRFVLCAPLPTSPRPSADPVHRWTFGASPPGFGSRSALVVSHHLDGFLRSAVPGMLQPVPDLGFAGLHRGRSSTAEAVSDRVPDSLRRAHPTKACSSPVAVPHHCGRSPPAVPESRDRSRATLRLTEARSTRWHSAPDLPPLRLPIRARRSPACLSSKLRSAPRAGRLQGLAPPTSPWHPVPLPASDARSFHGFPSPSRPASRRGNLGSRPDPIPRSVRLAWIRRSRPAYRPASVRRSVRNLSAAGLPGVFTSKSDSTWGVGLARKFD